MVIANRHAFRLEMALIAFITALMALSDAGWASLLLTPLGIGCDQVLRLLSSPITLGVLAILSPLWWYRAAHWANGHEQTFWNQGTMHKVGFLLIHWPLPLGIIAGLALAREAWDRMPQEEAIISHRRFYRVIYALILMVTLSLNMAEQGIRDGATTGQALSQTASDSTP